MRSLLIRCYPARWRARYGDEFEAILEERPLGPFDVADILLGALDAQLRLRGRGAATEQARSLSMSLRIGGIAAVFGASLGFIVIALIGGLTAGSEDASGIALLVALAALLVALTGMSAFQARTNPWLVWTAFAVTAVGMAVTFVAGVSDLVGAGPRDWRDGLLPIGAVAAVVGSALFGIATYRGSVLSRKGALSLVIGPAVGLIGAIAVGQNLWELGMLLVLVGIVSFLAGWFTLGIAAIRRIEHPRHSSRPEALNRFPTQASACRCRWSCRLASAGLCWGCARSKPIGRRVSCAPATGRTNYPITWSLRRYRRR